MDLTELEGFLRSLLRGQHSSLTLSFNEANGPNYQTVAEVADDESWPSDWVSEEEKQKAIAANSMWSLHWYPDTPIGFFDLAASSLPALIAAVAEHESAAKDS